MTNFIGGEIASPSAGTFSPPQTTFEYKWESIEVPQQIVQHLIKISLTFGLIPRRLALDIIVIAR